VIFVTKCHTENSSQISHLCRLFFWQYCILSVVTLRVVTTGEDRDKDRFKNWKLCFLWKLLFRHHGAIKLTQNCVCFTNQRINPFVPTFVTRKYHPELLECPTCCSVFSLTCRIHCLGRRKRINTSVFLELIFVPACSHAVENRSNACWRPCWEDPRMQYQFVRKKKTVHPAVPNSDTLVDASVTVYPIHIDQGPSHFGERIT